MVSLINRYEQHTNYIIFEQLLHYCYELQPGGVRIPPPVSWNIVRVNRRLFIEKIYLDDLERDNFIDIY